eukprot:4420822-Pleurochrysis_carterae.AAC.1
MKRALGKCGKLISDINNSEGVEQATKASRALIRTAQEANGPEAQRGGIELALKQMISGIIPEWRETDNKRGKGVIDSSAGIMGGGNDELGENTDEDVDNYEK